MIFLSDPPCLPYAASIQRPINGRLDVGFYDRAARHEHALRRLALRGRQFGNTHWHTLREKRLQIGARLRVALRDARSLLFAPA